MMTIKLLAAAALLASRAVVPAAESASVDFTQVLRDLSGKPYSECVRWAKSDPAKPSETPICEESMDTTLGSLTLAILDQPEQGIPAADKVRRGLLAIEVYRAKGPISISADDVKLIKDLMGKSPGIKSTALIQVYEMLDPGSSGKRQ